MNAIPFLLAAAVIPRDQWYERWKYINRLAGVVAESACSTPDGREPEVIAQEIIEDIERDFERFVKTEAGSAIAEFRCGWRELIDGLTKRVDECLLLGRCTNIKGVEAALDAMRRLRGTRS